MSEDENKNPSSNKGEQGKNEESRPFSERNRIGESKNQQDIIRKGAEIPPKTSNPTPPKESDKGDK